MDGFGHPITVEALYGVINEKKVETKQIIP